MAKKVKSKTKSVNKMPVWKRILLTALVVLLLLLAVAVLFVATIIISASFEDIDVDSYIMNQTSQVFYYDSSTGNYIPVEDIYSNENRIWVSYLDMPQHLKDAAVAIEDERFFKHNGVDIKRTLGATITYFFDKNKGYGGSTITQQVVKNITGHDERSISRKIKEMWNSFRLERKMSKEQILELYLNTIYLSQGCNGVGSAAKVYFNKDVSELTIAESAALVGITQYPTKYDPFLNPSSNKQKQEVVLKKMFELGYINEEEYADSVAQELNFAVNNFNQLKFNSYFVDQLIMDVAKELAETKSYDYEAAFKLLHTGGFKIYSTIDINVQNALQTVYEDTSNFPEGTQSAMVIIDPYTGEVKGMVGGVGKKNADFILNRATMTKRPPGSSIKPIAVYAPALEEGIITPYSVYEDKMVTYSGWTPSNFYSGYRGDMSIRTAVKLSTNTVAVQVLKDLGVEKSYDFLVNRLGITTLVNSRTENGKVYSDKSLASLGLGGLTDGVTVYEMAAAYAPFVNKGIYIKPHLYTKVVDRNGKSILEANVTKSVAMSESTATTMTELLMGVTAPGGTGSSAKVSGFQTAGKTGTTDHVYDKWFVGYTPHLVGAVWFGYDIASTIPSYATNTAINTWTKVMNIIHQKLPAKSFDGVNEFVNVSICSVSGKIAAEHCVDENGNSLAVSQYLPGGAVPSETCSPEDHSASVSEENNDIEVEVPIPPSDENDSAPPDIGIIAEPDISQEEAE